MKREVISDKAETEPLSVTFNHISPDMVSKEMLDFYQEHRLTSAVLGGEDLVKFTLASQLHRTLKAIDSELEHVEDATIRIKVAFERLSILKEQQQHLELAYFKEEE